VEKKEGGEGIERKRAEETKEGPHPDRDLTKVKKVNVGGSQLLRKMEAPQKELRE
jgi:hypothetical protein